MQSTSESGLKIDLVYCKGEEIGDEGVPYLGIFRTIYGKYFLGLATVVRNLQSGELEWSTFNEEAAYPYAYFDIPYGDILSPGYCAALRAELRKSFIEFPDTLPQDQNPPEVSL